jgi:hypothetical protein
MESELSRLPDIIESYSTDTIITPASVIDTRRYALGIGMIRVDDDDDDEYNSNDSNHPEKSIHIENPHNDTIEGAKNIAFPQEMDIFLSNICCNNGDSKTVPKKILYHAYNIFREEYVDPNTFLLSMDLYIKSKWNNWEIRSEGDDYVNIEYHVYQWESIVLSDLTSEISNRIGEAMMQHVNKNIGNRRVFNDIMKYVRMVFSRNTFRIPTGRENFERLHKCMDIMNAIEKFGDEACKAFNNRVRH